MGKMIFPPTTDPLGAQGAQAFKELRQGPQSIQGVPSWIWRPWLVDTPGLSGSEFSCYVYNVGPPSDVNVGGFKPP